MSVAVLQIVTVTLSEMCCSIPAFSYEQRCQEIFSFNVTSVLLARMAYSGESSNSIFALPNPFSCEMKENMFNQMGTWWNENAEFWFDFLYLPLLLRCEFPKNYQTLMSIQYETKMLHLIVWLLEILPSLPYFRYICYNKDVMIHYNNI